MRGFFARYEEQISHRVEDRAIVIYWQASGPYLAVEPYWRGVERMSDRLIAMLIFPTLGPSYETLTSDHAVRALFAVIKAHYKPDPDDPLAESAALDRYQELVDPLDEAF